MVLRWHDRTFGELTTNELYAITQLRERVFVVSSPNVRSCQRNTAVEASMR